MSKPQVGSNRMLMWGAVAFAFYACIAQWLGWATQGMPVVLPAGLTLGLAILLAWSTRGEKLPKSLFVIGSYGAVFTLAWAMGRPGYEYPGISVTYGLSILGTMFLFAVFWLWSNDSVKPGTWIPSAGHVVVPVMLLALGGALAYLSGERGAASPMVDWLQLWGLSPAVSDVVTLVFRKGVHVVSYGLLAGLAYMWASYLGLSRRGVLQFAWAWGLLHAVFDESHQFLSPSRQGTIWDVLINMLGMALALAWLSRRRGSA